MPIPTKDEIMAKAREVKAQKKKESLDEIREQRAASLPWKPAKTLDIPELYKDKRFVYRWVNMKKDGNVQRKVSEGWEIDKVLSKKLLHIAKPLEYGSDLDDTIQINGMIVMRMPKEIAEKRKEYYNKVTNSKAAAIISEFQNRVPSGYVEVA